MTDRKKKANSKKLEALEEEIRAVKAYSEREVGNLKRRVDRLEKSTHLVSQHSTKVEELYATAETSREFRKLTQDTAIAILGPPTPIPQVPPETFHAQTEENSELDLEALISWYDFGPALLSCVRFEMPNRSRKTRDPDTHERWRGKGHFLIRLEFGEGSLCPEMPPRHSGGLHIPGCQECEGARSIGL